MWRLIYPRHWGKDLCNVHQNGAGDRYKHLDRTGKGIEFSWGCFVNILDLNVNKRFCSGISKKQMAAFQSRLATSYPAFVIVGCNESVEWDLWPVYMWAKGANYGWLFFEEPARVDKWLINTERGNKYINTEVKVFGFGLILFIAYSVCTFGTWMYEVITKDSGGSSERRTMS